MRARQLPAAAAPSTGARPVVAAMAARAHARGAAETTIGARGGQVVAKFPSQRLRLSGEHDRGRPPPPSATVVEGPTVPCDRWPRCCVPHHVQVSARTAAAGCGRADDCRVAGLSRQYLSAARAQLVAWRAAGYFACVMRASSPLDAAAGHWECSAMVRTSVLTALRAPAAWRSQREQVLDGRRARRRACRSAGASPAVSCRQVIVYCGVCLGPAFGRPA